MCPPHPPTPTHMILFWVYSTIHLFSCLNFYNNDFFLTGFISRDSFMCNSLNFIAEFLKWIVLLCFYYRFSFSSTFDFFPHMIHFQIHFYIHSLIYIIYLFSVFTYIVCHFLSLIHYFHIASHDSLLFYWSLISVCVNQADYNLEISFAWYHVCICIHV